MNNRIFSSHLWLDHDAFHYLDFVYSILLKKQIIKASILLFAGFWIAVIAPTAQAQTTDKVEMTMWKMPGQSGKSVESIARYINQHFTLPTDKVKAIYVWMAFNIQYDMANKQTGITYTHINEVIERTLRTRKALCFGYAETFRAIAELTGVEVRVVNGYTRQQGQIDDLPHSWCAVHIGDQWMLVDPTWGAGHVEDGKYHRQLNYKWLMVSPDKMISSHMPFDPMLQFSYYPISHSDFIKGRKQWDTIKDMYFNFPDSIAAFDRLSLKQQLEVSNRRMYSQEEVHAHIKTRMKRNNEQIAYLQLSEETEQYNKAVSGFNEGVRLYNQAVDLKNKNKQNLKPQIELKKKQSSDNLQAALDNLSMVPPTSKLAPSARTLRKNILEIIKLGADL